MIRKRVSCLLLLGATAVFAGCANDTDGEPVTPTVVAGLRYVNLVPDTLGMDMRVIDVIGDAPNTSNATFRTGGQPYGIAITGLPLHTAVLAGDRHIRVFMSAPAPYTDTALATTVMLDTTYNFVANTNYTMYLYGYARTGGTPSVRALITEDAQAAAVPAGNVAVRTVNLAPDFQPTSVATSADVFVGAVGAAPPAGAPTNAGVGVASVSSYANLPVGTYQARVTPAGATSPYVAAALLPAGTAGSLTANPVAGTNIAGTAITLLIVPRSVPGSRATANFADQRAVALVGNADSTVTATTPVAHGLTAGSAVTIGCAVSTPSVFNGGFVVDSAPSATTFWYRTSNVGGAQTGYAIWYPTAQATFFNGVCVRNLTSAATTATVTTAAHGLAANDIITINGADQAEYNGTFVVASVPSTTTFTYTTNAAPAASPATGPVVWRRAANDYTRPDVLFVVDKMPPLTAP